MKYIDGKGFIPCEYENLGIFDEDKKCDLFPPKISFGEYVTYYFDSEQGDDLNDGLSENSPKKSIDQIQKIISTREKEINLYSKLLFFYIER